MSAAVNTTEKDIFSRDFTVGTYVMVRCLVTAITPTPPVSNAATAYYGGAGDRVALLVESPNPLDVTGVTLTVAPTQCRFTGSTQQA
jgi:hypothetical protein